MPDLRGVFLRAVNDFGVPGVQPVLINQAETDKNNNRINRASNSFEGDEFRIHNHSIPGPAAVGNIINNNTNFFNEPVGRQSAILTNNAGGDETRPKNVSVYYYIKIN
ncbi:hypothetical protein ACQ86N_27915 [Puia sp. P3]|uniref:hypothetical protein n=1 Tax=Puia sp. P3 TaxID=3423952 RepID=UPI003D6734AF